MSRKYKVLQFLHRVADRSLTLLLGKQFRAKYIATVALLKGHWFPEYSVTDTVIDVIEEEPIVLPVEPTIPDWLLAEMKVLANTIDPILYPTEAFVASCQHYVFPAVPDAGRVYAQLIQQCSTEQYDFCFAIPWLKQGGADFVTLKHLELARKKSDKVLVLLTEPGESPWLNRMPEGVDVLNVAQFVPELTHEESLMIIVRLLVQLDIKVLHIINSRHVWEIICKHGLAIRQRTKIFVSAYCDDYDHYGCPVGYARQYLGLCHQHITNVFSDNEAYPALLQNTYGYKPSLFSVLHSPINIQTDFAKRQPIGQRVLWAGRLDRQKRPDLLADIAEAMPDVEFHVYGDAVLEANNPALEKLEALANVLLRGHFDGMESLPFHEFPVFLYTSQWDGTPTIVLAAAFSGIPIVASAVGGVKDVVHDDSGFPIDEIENIALYVQAIRAVFANTTKAEQLATVAQRYVQSKHTALAFEQSLLMIEDYFNPSSSN